MLKLSSIKTRLFLSFSIFVSLTLVAVISSWLSFNALRESQSRALELHIPALVEINQLVELGGRLSLQTSRMIASESIAELNNMYHDLTTTLDRLQKSSFLTHRNDASVHRHSLMTLFTELTRNHDLIFSNTEESLDINQEIFEKGIQLDWSKNDTLDEISPLLEDMKFSLDLLLKEGAGGSHKSRQQMAEFIVLSGIRSQINLISSIVSRINDVDNPQSLENNRIYVYQLLEALHQDSAKLSGSASMLSATQSIYEFIQLIRADKNLFALNATRLNLLEDSLDLISSNQKLLAEFTRQIKYHARAQQNSIVRDAFLAEQKIGQSQFFMLVILIVCLVVALLTGWLYVDRSLVYRILRLHGNMQAIADGQMDTAIATAGKDEISGMARSLETFRDTLLVTQQELVQAGKLAALGQLSAGVAHELNQPLAAIRNFTHNTQVLLDRNKIAVVKENLADIESLTEKMAGIITQFKEFSRKPSEDIAPLTLSSVLESAVALLGNRIHEYEIDLQILPFDHEIQVLAESIRLEQVFINLLGNAVDALITSDEKMIQIRVESEAKSEMIAVFVKDSGAGIDGAERQRIFEPFYTTKNPGEGLGLGLSISYNIMRDFAGKLYLNTVAPQGAEFVIELKRAITR